MREKKVSLETLYRKGFRPKLCLDIGAAQGTVGLYEFYQPCKVILVEPSPSYIPALEDLAKTIGSAAVVHGLAGSYSGEVEVGISPEEGFLVPVRSKPEAWKTIQLTQYTVDQLVAREGVFQPLELLIKIDVDGAELDVLAGAKRAVDSGAVVIIEAVLLDDEEPRFHRIVDWFSKRQYCIIDIVEPLYRTKDELLWQVDLVFVPQSSALRDNLNVYA